MAEGEVDEAYASVREERGGWRSPGKVVGGRWAASSGSRWSGGGHRGSGWCGGAGGRQRAPAQMAAGRQQQRLGEGLQSQEEGVKRKGVSLALRPLAKQRPQYRHKEKKRCLPVAIWQRSTPSNASLTSVLPASPAHLRRPSSCSPSTSQHPATLDKPAPGNHHATPTGPTVSAVRVKAGQAARVDTSRWTRLFMAIDRGHTGVVGGSAAGGECGGRRGRPEICQPLPPACRRCKVNHSDRCLCQRGAPLDEGVGVVWTSVDGHAPTSRR